MVHESPGGNISKRTGSIEIFEIVAQVNKKENRQQTTTTTTRSDAALNCGVLWPGKALTIVSCRVVSCGKGRETEACTAAVRQ